VLSADEPLPNIVFVMIDTLRADRLGVHGYDRDLTPTMDAIAKEGVVFEHASAAAPWTQPSIASVFTGQYPEVHDAGDYRRAREENTPGVPGVPMLVGEFQTMAESLGDAGYLTAGVVSNHFVLAKFGYAQGFEHFDTRFRPKETPGSRVNAAALKWLDERDSTKPFFLYLHYMDVHSPYTDDLRFLEPLLQEVEELDRPRLLNTREYNSLAHLIREAHWPGGVERHAAMVGYYEYWLARYDAGVKQIDFYLDELRSGLAERGLWDDAYVIVTADHGEAFQEHGFWDHGHTVNEVELHVPLILRWPGKLSAGRRVQRNVSLVDLLPTLLQQFRLDVSQELQGRSLVPLLEGKAFDERPIFGERVRISAKQQAIKNGRWKLIESLPIGRAPKLYDLVRDPDEINDRAATEPDRVRELQLSLEAHRERSAALRPQDQPPLVPLTDDDIERLKALGYLD